MSVRPSVRPFVCLSVCLSGFALGSLLDSHHWVPVDTSRTMVPFGEAAGGPTIFERLSAQLRAAFRTTSSGFPHILERLSVTSQMCVGSVPRMRWGSYVTPRLSRKVAFHQKPSAIRAAYRTHQRLSANIERLSASFNRLSDAISGLPHLQAAFRNLITLALQRLSAQELRESI